MVRTSEYGSPFRNIGSGRNVRDSENDTKVAAILDKYWANQQGEAKFSAFKKLKPLLSFIKTF